MGPGFYDEVVSLKPNIFIKGAGIVLTQISSVYMYDSAWNGSADNRAGLDSVTVTSATLLDFVAAQSTRGKIFFLRTQFLCNVQFIACNTSDLVFFYECELLKNCKQQGGQVSCFSTTISGDVFVRDQGAGVNPEGHGTAVAAVATRFYGSGGGSVLPIDNSGVLPTFFVLNDFDSSQSHPILVDLAGFALRGNLEITGDGEPADTQVFVSAESVPSIARTTFTNPEDSESLILSTFANGTGYESAEPAKWASPAPTRVQDALDRMASLLYSLNGNTPIP